MWQEGGIGGGALVMGGLVMFHAVDEVSLFLEKPVQSFGLFLFFLYERAKILLFLCQFLPRQENVECLDRGVEYGDRMLVFLDRSFDDLDAQTLLMFRLPPEHFSTNANMLAHLCLQRLHQLLVFPATSISRRSRVERGVLVFGEL